jgi:hypothetical protein
MMRGWMIVLLAVGCASGDPLIEEAATCEDCLAAGGGWELESEGCVTDCPADASVCATEECPPSCAEECSGCLEQDECLGAGCVWIGADEDFYCAGG